MTLLSVEIFIIQLGLVKVERINPQENVDVRAFTERWKKPGDVVHYTALTDAKSYVHSERFIERKNEVFLSSLNFA